MEETIDVYSDEQNDLVIISAPGEVDYDMTPAEARGLAGALWSAADHVDAAADTRRIQEQMDKGLV